MIAAGFMGNGDIRTRLNRLQDRISEFYNDGKKSNDKQKASKLWINEKNVVVKKKNHALPGDHLVRAQYKDVIERDGSSDQKIRYYFDYITVIMATISCIFHLVLDCVSAVILNNGNVKYWPRQHILGTFVQVSPVLRILIAYIVWVPCLFSIFLVTNYHY